MKVSAPAPKRLITESHEDDTHSITCTMPSSDSSTPTKSHALGVSLTHLTVITLTCLPPSILRNVRIRIFRCSITIPFLDQLILMSTHFSALQSTAVRGLCLVPSVLVSLKTSDELDDLVRICQDDLPLPATWEAELHHWKLLWQKHADLPDTAARALTACNNLCTHSPPNSLYPPVTTSTRECSVSVIRRLKIYLRATVGQEKMSELTLMHIHYDVNWMLVK